MASKRKPKATHNTKAMPATKLKCKEIKTKTQKELLDAFASADQLLHWYHFENNCLATNYEDPDPDCNLCCALCLMGDYSECD